MGAKICYSAFLNVSVLPELPVDADVSYGDVPKATISFAEAA